MVYDSRVQLIHVIIYGFIFVYFCVVMLDEKKMLIDSMKKLIV
jgi:hypothetical protein